MKIMRTTGKFTLKAKYTEIEISKRQIPWKKECHTRLFPDKFKEKPLIFVAFQLDIKKK